jgi:hypothetical protein
VIRTVRFVLHRTLHEFMRITILQGLADPASLDSLRAEAEKQP